MKKKFFILVSCLFLALSVNAQIFLLDKDTKTRDEVYDLNLITPGDFNSDHDAMSTEFVPLGSGTCLLIGFCAAYMKGKKKRR